MTLIMVIGLFTFLSIVGMPLGFGLGIATMIAILATMNIPLNIVMERMLLGVDSFLFVAIPLFMMAASIMNRAGVTDRILAFATSLVGHIPGGLGHSNVVASIIFGGISGSAIADSAALGKIEIEAMTKQGYPKKFSAALTCASATIGPIFPPSIPMVIYGGIAGVSVGKLFLGGILPGLLIAACLMIMVYYFAIRKNYPREPFSLKRVKDDFLASFFPVMTPVLIVGGITLGVFTPTEAAAFTVLYAFILGFFVYRELKISMLPEILMETITTSAVVMFIISTASAFSWVLTRAQLGRVLSEWASSAGSVAAFLIVVNVILLILGMVMESTAILIIMTPLLVPVAQVLGIDLVHFGIMMVLNLMIGLCTPPFGLSLFTVSQIANMSLEDLMKAILPFIPFLLIALLLVMFIPSLTTWIPSLFFK
ncbi:TRAP transporter large permease [Ammoniphilus resinae]|uniref:Tripartite ATP-independent transporter DctM subunit n=1 Tax=Ammoniphilus resinae TaxID=861532 RepID=A0ABS4GTI9_9BACL|nr:TRAP transporter large permease [Ammoniphilus resinae]MBP1933352.1 tripartite ATP-independent transporter DctM subunit [Ammoniphilus resinae]